MNKMIIIGNLATDPVIREINSPNGPLKVCNFNVAVNERRNGQERTTFFSVSAWRGLADSCMQYLSKGKKVCVAGPLTTRAYIGNDGQPRAAMDIQANDLEFLSPVDRTAAPAPAAMPAAPAPNYEAAAAAPAFQAIQTDELPF